MNIKTIINWKLYFVLLASSIFSIIAIMPYILTLQADALKDFPSYLLAISIVQSAIFIGILLFIGIKLSKKLDLKISILENLIANKKIEFDVSKILKLSIILGTLSGVAIILFDFLFSQTDITLMDQGSIPIWQGFLASFYGGISEEIIMRLFFMTLIVWTISKFTKSKNKIIENSWVMWFSIIFAALVFGAAHLPVTSSLTTLTPLVVLRALLLNGIGGTVFGWLYWKKGLESAMLAHFSADIVIHVLLPLVLFLFF